jgi:hypothetical protein
MRLEEEGEGDLSWDVVYQFQCADICIKSIIKLCNFVDKMSDCKAYV